MAEESEEALTQEKWRRFPQISDIRALTSRPGDLVADGKVDSRVSSLQSAALLFDSSVRNSSFNALTAHSLAKEKIPEGETQRRSALALVQELLQSETSTCVHALWASLASLCLCMHAAKLHGVLRLVQGMRRRPARHEGPDCL